MYENKIRAAPIENKVAEIEAARRPERIPTGDVDRVVWVSGTSPAGVPAVRARCSRPKLDRHHARRSASDSLDQCRPHEPHKSPDRSRTH